MTEQVLTFGPHAGCNGILTEPAGAPATLAVLLSNTGMHHRVGPYRLNVELARALAGAGLCTFRYDRSGLGDSLTRSTPGTDHEHALQDARDAMDAVSARTGITQFVLMALCSGVDVFHEIARDDERVHGVVLIDGHAYATAGFRWRRWMRVLQWERYARAVRRRLHRRRHPGFFTQRAFASAVFARTTLPLSDWQRDMARLAARGTRVLVVNSGGADTQWNAAEQLFEQLGPHADRSAFTSVHLPDADHLFASPAQRARLVSTVVQWSRTLAVHAANAIAPLGAAACQGEITTVDTLSGGRTSDTVPFATL